MEYSLRHTTNTGLHVIKLGFFNVSDEGSCISTMVNWWTGGNYGHVELRFSDGHTTSITESPGTIHYDPGKLLSNPNYRCFFEIAIDARKEAHMQDIAKRCYEAEIPFSKMAMIWNFLPIVGWCLPMRSDGRNFFFCSQYITRLLQEGGLFMHLDADKTSPNDLYRAVLEATKQGIATVSYNREYAHKMT